MDLPPSALPEKTDLPIFPRPSNLLYCKHSKLHVYSEYSAKEYNIRIYSMRIFRIVQRGDFKMPLRVLSASPFYQFSGSYCTLHICGSPKPETLKSPSQTPRAHSAPPRGRASSAPPCPSRSSSTSPPGRNHSSGAEASRRR